MANLVAMLRLPSNLKSTQWQILAGPILILLILSMMIAAALPILDFYCCAYFIDRNSGAAGGVLPSALWILPRFQPFCCLPLRVWRLTLPPTRVAHDGRAYRRGGGGKVSEGVRSFHGRR